MIAVHLDNVSVRFSGAPIFENLSWEIHDDRVSGLIGPNGSGKSTLLALIAGELHSPTGYHNQKKDLTIGYLHQEPILNPDQTVVEEINTSLTELNQVEAALSRVETQIADPKVYTDNARLTRALDRQEKLLADFVRLGGPGREGRIAATLQNLGFSENELTLKISALSGGQRKLVGLAKLLIQSPDLLLLDEPDNHLDLEGKAFLEGFIRSYRGAVVIVSHDRYLLDLIVDEIVEIEDGNLTQFPGNYSEYAFEKQMRLQRQQQLFEAQQKEINRLEQSAKRLLLWGRVHDNEKFSRRGMNMLKRIEKIERIDRPVLERKTMGLELSGWRGSTKVLEILDLYKSFPMENNEENIILAGINLLILRGERVGLVGPNGAGKSVLFRLILDQMEPTDGEIRLGPSSKIGYYAQQHETLDPDKTLLDTVRFAANWSESRTVAFLAKFLFPYSQTQEPIRNLSGGERSRLQLALMMLTDANFLLLDEPTNNLDIRSAEVLENALDEFNGTVLAISHDRYFLDRVVDRVIELDGGQLQDYSGNYSDFLSASSSAAD
jgi:ATP-binding cassette subfamily F protein 3